VRFLTSYAVWKRRDAGWVSAVLWLHRCIDRHTDSQQQEYVLYTMVVDDIMPTNDPLSTSHNIWPL